ncbi:MAG: hypothetical protein WBA67_12965 [Jannaschia sp.]
MTWAYGIVVGALVMGLALSASTMFGAGEVVWELAALGVGYAVFRYMTTQGFLDRMRARLPWVDVKAWRMSLMLGVFATVIAFIIFRNSGAEAV